jgi:hypothetical protein
MVKLANLLKAVNEESLTEDFLEGLIGKHVHVSINEHSVQEELEGEPVVRNVWFAGKVAGYEKGFLKFDWATQQEVDEPIIHLTLLMTDGTGWLLSPTALEVQEITEEEFTSMVASEVAKQAVQQEFMGAEPARPQLSLITGGKQEELIVPNGGLLVPGRDF